MPSTDHYVHALRFAWLTRFYDPVVAILTRERTIKQAVIRAAKFSPSGLVLDIGCGTGTLALLVIKQHPRLDVCGIDGDMSILKRAQSKANRADLEVHLHHAMATELPFLDAQFDRVLSSLFFHHLSDSGKRRALAEIYRVLAPGGMLVVADWGRPQNLLMRTAFLVVQCLDGFDTTRANVAGQLPILMSQAGFQEVQTRQEYQTPLGTMALYCAIRAIDR